VSASAVTDVSTAAGATLVMPGRDLSGPAIAELIESERVTVAAGVPTHVHPHMLRAAFIMAALDAGVPLRDRQSS